MHRTTAMNVIGIAVSLTVMCACDQVTGVSIAVPAKTRDAVLFSERAGYTDVRVLDDHDAWPERYGCSGWGILERTFEMNGRDPQGRYVNYVVCCGEASDGRECGFAR